ncbi:MAG: TonB family protein [Balneolaceae bacterium]|nr:MAG: TonB family protein [Balneolaceae bacterium]
MESFVLFLADHFEKSAELFWIPVSIWTLVALLVWTSTQWMKRLHPQIHYHIRLAMLVSLPAGLLVLGLLHGIEAWFTGGTEEAPVLKVFTVMSPVEITLTSSGPDTALSAVQLFYASLSVIIISGMLVLLGRFFFQYQRLLRLKKACSLIDGENVPELSTENRRIISGLSRRVRIAFIEEEFIPVTFGFFTPVILLPESLRDAREHLNMVLQHELTHIREYDFVSHLMAVFTQSLFWFHPLIHLLKRELIEYRELRCDILVLQAESVSRKKYASLLFDLMPRENVHKELSVNMAQESSNLKKRIEMITKTPHPQTFPKRASITVFTALFLGMILFMACTEMQSHDSLKSQELEILTYPDLNGSVGYHRIVVILGDETQSSQNDAVFAGLRSMEPGHWMSMRELNRELAVQSYGDQAAYGAIEIHTQIQEESYNKVLSALGLSPQNLELYDPEEEQDFFSVVEQMPELIGGLAQLQREIRYPEMARRAGIEGRVFVQFIVNEEGEVEHPRVVRGIGGGADEEALRVVRQARFTPGFQRGRPVRVQYALPIFFRLANGGAEAESDAEEASLPPGEALDEIAVTGYTVSAGQPGVDGRQMVITTQYRDSGLRGRVLDAESGEPLAGASIVKTGTTRGAATNLDGYFTISDVSQEQMDLTVSFVGYETARISLSQSPIAAYGAEGADGVVVITTKTGSN